MEEVIFSYGGTKRVIAFMKYLKDSPAVAEAAIASSQIMVSGNDDGMNDKFNAVLDWGLKDFLSIFWRRHCRGDCRGGQSKGED